MARYDTAKEFDKNNARAKFEQYVSEGKKIDLTVVRQKRSLKQNAYLHVLITIYAVEIGLTLQEAKNFLKRECQFMTYQTVTKKNKEVKFLKQTSQLNSKEMSDFIDWIKTFAGQQGIYLPDSEQEYLDNQFDIDRHIEAYREFL